MPTPHSAAAETAIRPRSLTALARAAEECTRCPLYLNATQVVFGEGPKHAAIMLIGEQPGDQEDRAGRPFVGPAGRILDSALKAAELDRAALFVTNAVKHFKNEPRGKRRIHKRPNAYEIERCRWWLDQEISLVDPDLIVALGATAARSLLGRSVVISRERGKVIGFAGNQRALVTIHPSAILRIREAEERDRALAAFIRDLRLARDSA